MNKTKSKIRTKKRGRKMTIALIVLGVLVWINLTSLLINQIFFRNELRDVEPFGQMVEVNGKMMHVHSMGDGEQIIVLLPGFGTPVPSASFGPLMRELSAEFTVVVIEYFGVGFSDQIDTPRTNANYTQEIRAALLTAGFKPPYILMPHSASGVYAEYFATRHPNEVSALILLDTTPTHEVIGPDIPRWVGDMQRITQPIGLMRPVNRIANSTVQGFTAENGYAPHEINYIRRFTNHASNRTIVNQLVEHGNTVREVMDMPFPPDIPVLLITPTRLNSGVTEEQIAGHITRFGETSRRITLEGNHMIYRRNQAAILEVVNEFLGER